VQSEADIEQFIRDAVDTDYHPSFTCAMGSGELQLLMTK